jgi:hypothetical protein
MAWYLIKRRDNIILFYLFGRKQSWPDRGTMPNLSGRSKENQENPQDSRCPCWDPNLAPPELESRKLPLRQLFRSIFHVLLRRISKRKICKITVLWHPSASNREDIKTPWLLVRKRTIPTERPPLVSEVSANFSGQRVSRGQRNGFSRPLISVFVSGRYK